MEMAGSTTVKRCETCVSASVAATLCVDRRTKSDMCSEEGHGGVSSDLCGDMPSQVNAASVTLGAKCYRRTLGNFSSTASTKNVKVKLGLVEVIRNGALQIP
jgi:hypothetical protein